MKPSDRNNLNFLMSLDDSDFDMWADSASDDELAYAMEILREARSENIVEEMELTDESSIISDEVKKMINRIKGVK